MAIEDGLLRRLRTMPEDRIVAELKRVYARRGREPRRPTTVPDATSDDQYEQARRLFGREEQRLRRQASVVEQIIDKLRERGRRDDAPARVAPSRSSQETLFLRAAAGRPAAGRFRLANHFARALTVALAAAPLRARDGATIACPIAIRPARLTLEPGATHEVRVTIDLAAARPAAAARGVLETEIVAEAHGTSLHRLWIEIDVYPSADDEGDV